MREKLPNKRMATSLSFYCHFTCHRIMASVGSLWAGLNGMALKKAQNGIGPPAAISACRRSTPSVTP